MHVAASQRSQEGGKLAVSLCTAFARPRLQATRATRGPSTGEVCLVKLRCAQTARSAPVAVGACREARASTFWELRISAARTLESGSGVGPPSVAWCLESRVCSSQAAGTARAAGSAGRAGHSSGNLLWPTLEPAGSAEGSAKPAGGRGPGGPKWGPEESEARRPDTRTAQGPPRSARRTAEASF